MFGGKPKYRDDFPKRAYDFLSQGYTVTALAAELGVRRKIVYEWMEKFPDFNEAVKLGQEKAQRFFEQRLILMSKGDTSAANKAVKENVNMTALIFTLKTRFHQDFGNKQTIEHTGKIDSGPDLSKLTPDQLKKLESILEQSENTES